MEKFTFSMYAAKTKEDLSVFTDYEKAKGRLFVKAVGKCAKEIDKTEIIHRTIEDLQLIPYLLLSEGANGMASAPVAKAMVKKYGVSEEKLIDDAILNSMKIFPEVIDTLDSMVSGFMGFKTSDSDTGLIVVTNSKSAYGASALFYPGVMEKLGLMIGSDYYVLPSSVHEVIIVPKSLAKKMNLQNTGEKLNKMVKDVNQAIVNLKDQLSDHVYYYNIESKALYAM